MKYLKIILVYIGLIILFSLINTSLFYVNIINENILITLNYISYILTIIIISYHYTLISKNNYKKNTIVLSLFYIITSFIFLLIFKKDLNITIIFKYLMVLLITYLTCKTKKRKTN